MIQLSQIIDRLKDTYNSIDVRTASYKKVNAWHSSVVIIRFRKESPEELSEQHDNLIAKYGSIQKELFRVDLFSFPISKWEKIRDDWTHDFICLKEDFAVNIDKEGIFNIPINEPRIHNGFDIVNSDWLSYHVDKLSSNSQAGTVVANFHEYARENRSRDMHEYFANIFEVTREQVNSIPKYIVIAPVFFKLENIEFDENSISIDCVGFGGDTIDVVIDFSIKPRNVHEINCDRIKINHVINGDKNKKVCFNIKKELKSVLDWNFRIDIYRENGVLIASKSDTVSNCWPTKGVITNPLFEIFKSFVGYEELENMIINLKSEKMKIKAPDKIFERGISWMLNLLGFSTIQLQEYEVTGEDPNKISFDFVGQYEDKIILSNVTIGMIDVPMLETERNRRIIISENISDQTKLCSVLFTIKSVKEFNQESTRNEVAIIGKEQLQQILGFLKNGDIDQARNIIIPSQDPFGF